MFALLVRTVYSPGQSVERDMLLRSMWAGQPEARQRGNLRQALYKLRLLGVRIGLAGDVVILDPTQLVPVFALTRTAARLDEDRAATNRLACSCPVTAPVGRSTTSGSSCYVNPFMPTSVECWSKQLSARRERADWTGADALAKWLLQFDPFNEEATLTVAECLALNGSKTEAVALIDRYVEELGEDAADIRLSATLLRRRICEPHRHDKHGAAFAPAERHFVGREQLMSAHSPCGAPSGTTAAPGCCMEHPAWARRV